MSEILGNKKINSQFLGNKPIIRTYKGDELLNEYKPLYNPPSDWKDIRTDCPENSIALYAAHPSDFSAYDNLGFTATCTGGYNVFIDGAQYGTTYASEAQCSITWSTSSITTGDNITTPSAMKAHKIWIEPATEGNNITAFNCDRVASSGDEEQGLLWAHYNISNVITFQYVFRRYGYYNNRILKAITAKNNIIKTSSFYLGFYSCPAIEYVPIIDFNNTNTSLESAFQGDEKVNNIALNNCVATSLYRSFYNNYLLNKIKTKNFIVHASNVSGAFYNTQVEDISPLNIDWSYVTNATDFIVNDTNLKDTIIDTSASTGLTKIGCYGDNSHFMGGLKGLRVSSSAPFDSTTSPQINVSYTGMDRQALVTLFNDLPTVSSGQIINITGCTGTSNLTADDKAIVTNKGWTITE